ncbi:MAG TPA: EthD domain-containing protein [Acidimicrobiales bacterium]
MEKRIYVHRRRETIDDAAFASGYRAAHETLVADTGARCAVAIALADQSPMERVGLRPRPLLWHGVSSRWGDVASSSRATAQLDEVVEAASGWRVEERVAWEDDVAPDPSAPGVKSVSFVVKPGELSVEEFRRHYREHAEIARDHHGCWKYVQNVVLAPVTLPPGKVIHAVSELWFRSLDDFVEHFYRHGAASVEAVRKDTADFVDFASSTSMLVSEMMLSPG